VIVNEFPLVSWLLHWVQNIIIVIVSPTMASTNPAMSLRPYLTLLAASVVSMVAGEKKDRPISGRVKEIAEFMLHLVMENVVRIGAKKGKEGKPGRRKHFLCQWNQD